MMIALIHRSYHDFPYIIIWLPFYNFCLNASSFFYDKFLWHVCINIVTLREFSSYCIPSLCIHWISFDFYSEIRMSWIVKFSNNEPASRKVCEFVKKYPKRTSQFFLNTSFSKIFPWQFNFFLERTSPSKRSFNLPNLREGPSLLSTT